MSYNKSIHLAAVKTFQELHQSGCFVLPNPWDRGTAMYLAHVGFKALATSSAGFAFSRGLPDQVSAIPVESVLDHARDIVDATPLPVNVDFQNGYADRPADVATNVKRCVETGVAGLSIEDATGREDKPLYESRLAVERIIAAREAIDATGIPVVLTARCEAWLVGDSNARQLALDRLVEYAAAGADCLYAPGVTAVDDISDLVKAVAPKPVNILAYRPGLTVSQLGDLGARRISVGSSLARVAWGAFMEAAKAIANEGTFDCFGTTASFKELNEVFEKKA